jgi:hypothetical protein
VLFVVRQVANLQRVANPLVGLLVTDQRVTNPLQVTNLPHKLFDVYENPVLAR